MILVLFELSPKPGQTEAYFSRAEQLRASLSRVDGFISVERFQSTIDPSKYLSLSVWRDEQALTEWRNQSQHRSAQQEGRNTIFSDYRLRVALVQRDYGFNERKQAPIDSQHTFDETT